MSFLVLLLFRQRFSILGALSPLLGTQSPSTSAAVMAPAPVQAKVPSTEPFLNDFTLVAEAAKRAQAAVMVRDFADMGL
ncbi:hypothetical protein J3F83DRAFT_716202 [Trichoderma novae-zelandiae]